MYYYFSGRGNCPLCMPCVSAPAAKFYLLESPSVYVFVLRKFINLSFSFSASLSFHNETDDITCETDDLLNLFQVEK